MAGALRRRSEPPSDTITAHAQVNKLTLAPKSSGMMWSRSRSHVSSCSNTQPACHTPHHGTARRVARCCQVDKAATAAGAGWRTHLAHKDAGAFVERYDVVHECRGNHDFVVHRHAAADQPGVAAVVPMRADWSDAGADPKAGAQQDPRRVRRSGSRQGITHPCGTTAMLRSLQ